jgi:hypothetical protein
VRNTQFFDLKDDPDELHNLAGDPSHAEQLARLCVLLSDAQKQFGDPYLLSMQTQEPGTAKIEQLESIGDRSANPI